MDYRVRSLTHISLSEGCGQELEHHLLIVASPYRVVLGF